MHKIGFHQIILVVLWLLMVWICIRVIQKSFRFFSHRLISWTQAVIIFFLYLFLYKPDLNTFSWKIQERGNDTCFSIIVITWWLEWSRKCPSTEAKRKHLVSSLIRRVEKCWIYFEHLVIILWTKCKYAASTAPSFSFFPIVSFLNSLDIMQCFLIFWNTPA